MDEGFLHMLRVFSVCVVYVCLLPLSRLTSCLMVLNRTRL